MINLNSISTEVYRILRQFDYTLIMYDEGGEEVFEPEDARNYFAKPENIMVCLVDDNDNSEIKVFLGKSSSIKELLGLSEALKNCASKYNILYDISHDEENEIEPKRFATKASIREGRTYMKELTEGLYGTSRSSYLTMENARMIIRHSGKIDENIAGARSRKIDRIFVENAQGERHLMPVNNLATGRAMTQHVNQGGSFYDAVGGAIANIGQSFQDLGSACGFMQANAPVLAEGAQSIREKCLMKRKAIRESLNRLFRESTYAAEAAKLEADAAKEKPLVEASVMENLRETLTTKSGKKLAESLLQTVAGVMSEEECEDEGMLAEVADQTQDEIEVMGQKVSRQAIQDLMQGKMPIRKMPDFGGEGGSLPTFKTTNAQIIYKVERLVPVIMDSSLANLLGAVVEEFNEVKDPTRKSAMLKLMMKALYAAKVKITEHFAGRGLKVIREFEEWFSSFDPDGVLMEDAGENLDLADDLSDEDVDLSESDEAELDLEATNVGLDEDAAFGEEDVDLEEDVELRREDILLPKNQGFDLAREVAYVPEEEEGDDLTRLVTLAGVRQ